MNAALLATGLVVCIITLVIVGLKMAQKGGERRGKDRERADRLAESAERRAKADAEAARDIVVGDRLAALALQYRNRRLRDLGEDPEGGGST